MKENKTQADKIIFNATQELKSLAGWYIMRLYLKLNNGLQPKFNNDEEYVFPFTKKPVISVKSNDVEDNVFLEPLKVHSAVWTLDEELILQDKDGEEWFTDEYSIEELANIVNVLEKEYRTGDCVNSKK